MENASKALIIAGAILISIILISIGILVVNSSSIFTDTAEQSLDQADIERFNGEFFRYEGVKKGSEVKTLMSKITTSNSAHAEDGRVVTVTGPNGETEPEVIRQSVKATSSYTITFTTDPTTSLVVSCTITAGSNKTSGSGTSTKAGN